MSPREKIGEVAVDTGTVFISDPCYRDRFGSSAEMLENLTSREISHMQLVFPNGHSGAVLAGGFGGDGTYPVFAVRDEEGLLLRIEIVFKDE